MVDYYFTNHVDGIKVLLHVNIDVIEIISPVNENIPLTKRTEFCHSFSIHLQVRQWEGFQIYIYIYIYILTTFSLKILIEKERYEKVTKVAKEDKKPRDIEKKRLSREREREREREKQ